MRYRIALWLRAIADRLYPDYGCGFGRTEITWPEGIEWETTLDVSASESTTTLNVSWDQWGVPSIEQVDAAP